MTVGWDELNAYADGELAPAEAAEVAAAIARDPHLAARVASLSRLKAHLAVQPPAQDVPSLPLSRPSPAARLKPLAASVALLAAALLAVWMSLPQVLPSDQWLSEVAAAHHAWLDQAASAVTGDRVEAARTGVDIAAIPDLSEARLTLVHVSKLGQDRTPNGLFLGYQGIHGCRVGLWVGQADSGLAEHPAKLQSGGLSGYAWRNGVTGYALLAREMDPDRLKLLADTVARITGAGHRMSGEIRSALRQTTVTGRPCIV